MKNYIKFSLMLLALLLPGLTQAHDFEVNGIYYNINGNEATVTYRGTYAYQYSNEYSGDVFIPATVAYNGTTYSVTAITDNAFYFCSLTSVTIPNSVTSIGNFAFYCCGGLISIDIPNSVTSIGSSAFYGCIGLTNVTIPNSVTSIGGSAFEGCSRLTDVYSCITDLSRVVMGSSVFYLSSQDYSSRILHVPYEIMTVYQTDMKWSQYFGVIVGTGNIKFVDENVKTLCVQNWDTNSDGELSADEAAAVTGLGTVFKSKTNISSFDELQYFTGLTDIAAQAFANCRNLTRITIPNSVASIGNGAFSYCSVLTSIDIPNSVTTIGQNAFSYCSGLSNVSIGSLVTTIGQNAFNDCTGLACITVANDNLVYDSRDNSNAVIETVSNTLLLGCKNTEIPNTVTTIGYAAFRSSGLESITIPNSVTYIGEWAFGNCIGLTFVDIPNSVQTIYNSAFNGCSGLASVTIPSSVSDLRYCAFANCSGLTDVYSCITDISDIYIGSMVFNLSSQDYSKRTLHVPHGTLAAYQAEPKWSQYFGSIVEIRNIDFVDENVKSLCVQKWDTNGDGELDELEAAEVTTIGTVFRSNTNITSFDELQYFTGLTEITAQAFASCRNLKRIIIPSSVTNIGYGAFSNCSGLTSIVIGNSVTNIGNSAFYSCSSLRQVIIPNSVANIGSEAFRNCSSLTNVYSFISDLSAVSCGSNIFSLSSNNYSNRTLHVPVGSSAIYYQADLTWSRFFWTIVEMGMINFADANVKAICVQNWDTNGDGELSVVEAASVTSLGTVFKSNTNITSFDELQYFTGLTAIDGNAFNYCTGLTSISIPNSVTTIGAAAFGYCGGLTSITIPNSVTTIGQSAFSRCTGLTSITIPNSVTAIGSGVLDYCSGLTSITVESGNPVYDSRDNCNAIIETASNTLLVGCKTTVIPNTVTAIGDYAFNHCAGLTGIEIPNSVTTIGLWAFGGCTGLTSVDIPNSVTTIDNSAFNGCSGLTSVTIPASVSALRYCAFANCSSLKDVYSYITDISDMYIGSMVFNLSSQDYSGRTLHVPYGTLAAYQAEPKWSQYFGAIVEMDPVTAESIELDKTEAVVFNGETLQLIATVLPDNTYNKVVAWTSSDPTVATVDESGLVTGIILGFTTITATTTDGSNLSASCSVTVSEDLSEYDYYLSVSNTSAWHGDTIVIPVAMINEDANIISFQTDIFMPEGLEIVQEDGEYLIEASDRMTRTHGIMSNAIASGAIRVVCYSSNYKPFTGDSGDDLFYITVKVAENANGNYTISLKNTVFTTSDFEEISVPDVAAIVNVKSYPLGDANGSYSVTITDVVVTSKYILEMNPSPFIFEAADVNADGNITVTDVSRIAYLVMNAKLNGPRRMPALTIYNDRMSAESVKLMPGETRTVSIMLDNSLDYSAFQVDLKLPDGLKAENFALTGRAGDHTFDINRLSSGKLRALCFSTNLEEIEGNSGALLTFDVSAAEAVVGDIIVDGIELVTTDCQTVKLDAFTIAVNCSSNVNELSNAKTVAKVDYYNLAGQRIDQPNSGVTIVVTTYTDGTRTTTKVIQ